MVTVAEIAKGLSAPVLGDGSLSVTGAAEPDVATPQQIAIATSPAYANRLPKGHAKVALIAQGMDWQALGLAAAIPVARGKWGMAGVTRMLDPRWRQAQPSVHPTAIIDPSAQIGAGASIGAFVCIEADAVIGKAAHIGAHSYIGKGVQLGDGATLAPRVTLCDTVQIGARFVAHSGVVVGGDGYSFVTPEESGVERARASMGDQGDLQAQSWVRVHSLGAVRIGDDVELGSNVCVDRGTLRDTEIGDGVKVDNLSQIGHNVQIGRDTLVCAQVGIAGSSRIGNNVVLGGQTGVSDNVFVGDNAITGGATKVLSNVPAGRVMLGYPAVKMDQQLEIHRALRKLPRALRDLARLKTARGQSD